MGKKESVIYFAYGSNMDLRNLEKLKVKVFKVEKAKLEKHQLIFNVVNDYMPGAGYANIEPHPYLSVEGIIIHTEQNSIKNLDDYEGFPYLYHKKFLTVIVNNNQRQEALVYSGNPMRLKSGLKPSKDHFYHILQGKSFLSKDYWLKLSQTELVPD
ncbi:gamma-glutamylcyclotransferase [soil metagenome]